MALTKDQALRIIAGGAMLRHAFAELSDFELELMSEISLRWLRLGMQAEVTDLEWPVIDRSIDAMRAAFRAGRIEIPTAYRIAA